MNTRSPGRVSPPVIGRCTTTVGGGCVIDSSMPSCNLAAPLDGVAACVSRFGAGTEDHTSNGGLNSTKPSKLFGDPKYATATSSVLNPGFIIAGTSASCNDGIAHPIAILESIPELNKKNSATAASDGAVEIEPVVNVAAPSRTTYSSEGTGAPTDTDPGASAGLRQEIASAFATDADTGCIVPNRHDTDARCRAAFAPPFSNTTDTGAPPCENPTFGTTPVACIGRGDHVIDTRLDVLCKFSLDMTPNFNALDAPARCSVLSGM
eukprot:31176-Pelagococcus_subviridis.AAC.62